MFHFKYLSHFTASSFLVVWCSEKVHGFLRKLSSLFYYQPMRAYFFTQYCPSDDVSTEGTVYLTTCSAGERAGVIQELLNSKVPYSEITSRRYVVPEQDKAFVFVDGRIQPARMEDVEDFSLQ